MFGVLNTLLFYPSGAMYPIAAFPPWLRALGRRRSLHLCDSRLQGHPAEGRGFLAIRFDLFFLFVFGIGTLLVATPLFKRTL